MRQARGEAADCTAGRAGEGEGRATEEMAGGGERSVSGIGDIGGIGAAIDVDRLARLRGGDSTVENDVLIDGTVDGNTADHVVSGSNSISEGAFANAAGINTVIQNTGSNVLIQNGMVVNIQFVAPVP